MTKAICLFVSAGIALSMSQSCAPKRMTVQPAAQVERNAKEQTAQTTTERKSEPVSQATSTSSKPNYEFRDIQFELDSYVLKTESYAVLDRISREMLKDTNAKFFINGHASVEGGSDYNMKLSIDRANAVKIYLVNSGVPARNLETKGFGATKPIASNDTESGRVRNRRVEIKVR